MSSKNTHFSNFELDKIFKKAEKIFFIGIGGISMSSLAEYCVYVGKSVFGYDRCRGEECKRLEKVAHIRYSSTTDSVMGMDLVVFSNAIDEECFELKTSRELGIPTVSRANFLAYIMADYRVRIGVSGMHGKSTVTSMLAHVFRHTGCDPTVICGAKMKEFDAPYRFGRHEYFIFEACEYMNSFLSFSPTDAVVTNIDFDHPDFFEDMGHVLRSFRQYILPAKRVYVNADNPPSGALSHPYIITFGIENNANYMAKINTGGAKNAFTVIYNGKPIASITLKDGGRHNIYNALCAFSVAHQNGIAPKAIAHALSKLEGIARRQELIKKIQVAGNEDGILTPVFLDYAHHPTEIKASLSAFRDNGFKKILCVFQSHTYSRTYALYGEFLSAFTDADQLIVAPIYSAREQNIYPITSEGLANDLGALYIKDFTKISEQIKASSADCVVIMGAGDIEKVKNYI